MRQSAEDLIQQLGLQPHQEGGYYRRTYAAAHWVPGAQPRRAATSIYYLLTARSPIGYWHQNQSDILHFYQAGAPLTYWVLHPNGQLHQHRLGPDMTQGQQLQLQVPGRCWKATELVAGEYGLLSEVVVPGFDYADMTLATAATIQSQLTPEAWEQVQHLIQPESLAGC